MNLLNTTKLKSLLNTDIKSIRLGGAKKVKKIELRAPKYLYKKFVAFDVGSSSIKVVSGKQSKSKVSLYDAFTIEIPEGAVVDGNVLNVMEIERLIRSNMEMRKTRIKDVVCTSNSTAVINRELILPKVHEEELKTLVEFEIQQYLPINMDDYSVQHKVVEELEVDGVEKYKVLVVTYPNKLSRNYFQLIKQCKLNPCALDITSNSLNKLLSCCDTINGQPISENEYAAYMDMGSENINIQIYNKGKLDFTRAIKTGGGDLDGVISRELGISLNEGKKRKLALGDITSCAQTLEEQQLYEIVKEQLDQWVNDISRIIQFYKNKNVGNRVDKVYLYGGASRIKGIDAYFASKLNISTFKITEICGIECKDGEILNDLDIYINAIGSLIRY